VWSIDLDPVPATLEADLCFDLAPFRSAFPGVSADTLDVVTRPEQAADWTRVATTELRDATGSVVGSEGDATQICAVALTSTSEFAVVGTAGPLPVELAGFTASLDGAGAVIAWTTLSETNNAGFEVERRLGGAAFQPIGFVDGAGTVTTPRDYRFTDRALPFEAQEVTYRLRQVDVDGTMALSDEVRLRRGAPPALVIHGTYPNPARTSATVRYELPSAGPVRIALYNVLGQRVQTVVDAEQPAGRVEQMFDTGGLASGVYFLRLETRDGVQTQRLSVVR